MDAAINNISWLAVGSGTILSFLLGWLWYSPTLFGVKWAEGVGVTLGDETTPHPLAMISQLLATFLLAVCVALCMTLASWGFIALIALMLVCFIVAAGLFAQKSPYAITTEASFIVAMVVLMLLIQYVFV